MLGIDQPIVQAPMAAVPGLAAAVSNAGALGPDRTATHARGDADMPVATSSRSARAIIHIGGQP
jgi:NAD(P)H-dependent flavin oxidoreductase YrpB (nitropropane dioxygenase family)